LNGSNLLIGLALPSESTEYRAGQSADASFCFLQSRLDARSARERFERELRDIPVSRSAKQTTSGMNENIHTRKTTDGPIGQINSDPRSSLALAPSLPPSSSRSLISFSSGVINFPPPQVFAVLPHWLREAHSLGKLLLLKIRNGTFRRISHRRTYRVIFSRRFFLPAIYPRQRGYDRHLSTSTGDIFSHELPKSGDGDACWMPVGDDCLNMRVCASDNANEDFPIRF